MSESAPKLIDQELYARRQEIADAISTEFDLIKTFGEEHRSTVSPETYRDYMDELVILYHSSRYTTQFLTLQLRYGPKMASEVGPKPDLKLFSVKLQHEYAYNVQTARESDIATNMEYAKGFLEKMRALPQKYGFVADEKSAA